MEMSNYQLVLGSGSPRRKELLAALYLPFTIKVSDIDEITEATKPDDVVKDLALLKGRDILSLYGQKSDIILAADTIVVLDDKILGKPQDVDDAREMLKSLSGKTHSVLTGVALLSHETEVCFYEESQVTFREISDDLLELYLATGESLDKAGAYGIQSKALAFIEKLDGSYSNVVGLPLDRVLIELKKFIGVENDTNTKWRELFV